MFKESIHPTHSIFSINMPDVKSHEDEDFTRFLPKCLKACEPVEVLLISTIKRSCANIMVDQNMSPLPVNISLFFLQEKSAHIRAQKKVNGCSTMKYNVKVLLSCIGRDLWKILRQITLNFTWMMLLFLTFNNIFSLTALWNLRIEC